jgi:hypothetical protein
MPLSDEERKARYRIIDARRRERDREKRNAYFRQYHHAYKETKNEQRAANWQIHYAANRSAYSDACKAAWRERQSPMADHVYKTFELLPEEHRAEFACWLMLLADHEKEYRDVIRSVRVDHWLALYDDAISEYMLEWSRSLRTPA